MTICPISWFYKTLLNIGDKKRWWMSTHMTYPIWIQIAKHIMYHLVCEWLHHSLAINDHWINSSKEYNVWSTERIIYHQMYTNYRMYFKSFSILPDLLWPGPINFRTFGEESKTLEPLLHGLGKIRAWICHPIHSVGCNDSLVIWRNHRWIWGTDE